MIPPLIRLGALLASALVLCAALPLRAAGMSQRVPVQGYQDVYLEEDGSITPQALEALSAGVKEEARGERSQIVVLVHGYNTSYTLGRRQYREIARLLREAAREQGWRPIVVGVHWPSYPGPPLRWLPKMLGYRFLSAAGFPNAIPNPYLQKVSIAAGTGRLGLRSLLFRLQEDFPHWPLHALAHSMGSEVVVRALAPHGADEEPITQPERELRLGMVALAGADLDTDAFVPQEPANLAPALPRADLWWITVPRRNSADAALELRRAAGRRDALGNVGLTLTREQLDRLLSRRGLVIDNRSVPIGHDLTDYYNGERLRSIAAALQYLDTPPGAADRSGSVLAILDRILRANPTRLPDLKHVRGVSARLYIRWRREPERRDYGPVQTSQRSPGDAVPTAQN